MNSTLKSKQWTYRLFYVLLLFIPQMATADNSQTGAPATTESLPIMPTIHVEAIRVAPTTGMTIIDKEMIENLPTRNGSINEIISVVPGVQYSEDSLNSFTGGEITPPVVSISGSRFYDNNYTIDGISNNNPLDPVFDSISSPYKLPGHPQIHFLSPKVIEQITVYNSNIPAAFGGFTGGQIDTQTINPTSNFWGDIHYRTTSDNWTKFHIDPINQEDFYHSNGSDNQPTFRKHDFGFTINTPLGIDTSLVTSYQQLYSKIKLEHLDEFNTQKRKHETLFAKLKHYLTNDFNISLTALYSPTSAQYFSPNIKDSDYNIDSDNYSLSAQVEKYFSKSQLSLTLGYTNQNNTRNAPENRFSWSSLTDSIDWTNERYGVEGALGDLETGQDKISIKSDILFNSINLGQTSHIFNFGGEATYSNQYYHRPKASHYYNGPVLGTITTPIACNPDDPACIENEQYLYKRTVYKQADADVEITDIAVFLQDSIIWKRLEVVPGFRLSYDDFTKNTNIAPRFAISLDIFGNQVTTLFAGKNRYYSGTLLTHALYEDIEVVKQERDDNNSDWKDTSPRPITFRYQTGGMKTPYSDELTLGIIQKILGGKLKVQYVEKKNKDEFARNRIVDPNRIEPDIYLINNFGRSEHKSLQLSWQRSWINHFLEINATWQETTTSHDDYFETLDEDDIAETIWYKGDELYYYEIPKTDFNRPVIANLIYTAKLPYNITFTNTTKYRGAYWKLLNTREKQQSNINPEQDSYIYEKKKSKRSVLFDWRLSWKSPQFSEQNMTLTLDIYNVFNRRVNYDYQSGVYGYNYELGRQLWAGLTYNF
ncbi:MAG: TonB-dependent receptor [Desulfuromusa sp.]|nr:TonB-dependent receptor [Desulfuromusa sp.]